MNNYERTQFFPSLLHCQVFALLSQDSAHKLLILAGQSVEDSGDLLFHRGLFSPEHLRQIIKEQVQRFTQTKTCLIFFYISLNNEIFSNSMLVKYNLY